MAAKQGPVSGDISHAAGALLHQGLHEVADPATKIKNTTPEAVRRNVFIRSSTSQSRTMLSEVHERR